MKHRVVGRKLGRTSAHRLALLRNLSEALFLRERITTTLGKAKELRPFAERLVTLSKRETLHARRQVLRHIHAKDVVSKLFDTLSARFAQRPGGYTRILKLGPRRGDNAEMAIIELVGYELQSTKKKGADAKAKAKLGKGAAAPAAEESAKAKPTKKGVPSKKGTPAKEKEKPPAKEKDKDKEKDKSAKPRKSATSKKEQEAKTKQAKGRVKPSSTTRKGD